MRTVLLSDHPDDMLTAAMNERQQAVSEQETVVGATARSRDEVRAQGRRLTWLRLTFRARREKRELARRRMFSRIPTGREDAIRAGRDAERRVAADLAGALGLEWVLFRGYRNRRGEIDGLLLGPRGLFAYDTTARCVRGDDWQSEKFDRYGNLVEARAPVRDRRGRSPSRQLNESVAVLADWLGRRGQRTTITPVVLLVHDRARIGTARTPAGRAVTQEEVPGGPGSQLSAHRPSASRVTR